MKSSELDRRILQTGKEFFSLIAREAPSVFNRAHWMGKALDWCMKNEAFKVQLLRFVDVFPTLNSSQSLTRHLEEYFGGANKDATPSFMKLGIFGANIGGTLGANLVGKAIRSNINEMASQFIIGESSAEAVQNLGRLRDQGFVSVIDLLGEAVVGESEADHYQQLYEGLLDELKLAGGRLKPVPSRDGQTRPGMDWGYAPITQISIKCSALSARIKPEDVDGSVESILRRLEPIYEKVIAVGGAMALDMESHQYKDIILEVFRRLRINPRFRDYPHLCLVLQSYLRETDADLENMISWAREHALPMAIRLVKGAYWDYETILAEPQGWEPRVWAHKAETDAAFERHAHKILENHDICYLACGSHNIRSVSAVIEMAKSAKVPDDRYEFQVLFGMAEPVRKALVSLTGRVRLYCPFGKMVPGMAYLVRRLLENTANESFLRQTFVEGTELERLLRDPVEEIERRPIDTDTTAGVCFKNHPAADFTEASQRAGFKDEILRIRTEHLGKIYPLWIDGRYVETSEILESLNPSKPSEIIGRVCQASTDEVEAAVRAARLAFDRWGNTSPSYRADHLKRAAGVMRRRLVELAAWQVLEVGKQWDQAHADVAEAIDFLEYYAFEMLRLGRPRSMGSVAGENNQYGYEPKGVAAVIAPWNFPLAISTGMVAASIVTGNCVVFKPSGLSSVIGHHLVEIFSEVGLPPGVFNYIPGRSRTMGDFLVEHPHVNLIAFTGSKEVGLRILNKASVVHPTQCHVKKVIAEMGGKNAIIIDDDADLDEAVVLVIESAFGFQGQKCSACSRVIVLEGVYDRFVRRLVEAARSLKIGPADNPANDMGAVVDRKALENVRHYAETAKEEGRLLFNSEAPAEGYFASVTIVDGIEPKHRIAQEEVFGPVLSVMRVKDFDQALEWANATPFGLVGGVFSRSPSHLERARREFRVGNLYLNRGCTGALVERQAFGGSRLSGVGSKAGGPDYLLQFMDPRVITENTMRRGFAPTDHP